MKISKTIQEKILFSRLKNKDKQAFIKVYDLYAQQLYRFVFFKVGNNKEEAEDLTAAVFLKTWKYLQDNSVINYKSLKSLIYTIARNTIIDYYRKDVQRKNIAIDNLDNKLDIIDEKQNISVQLELSEDFANIQTKLLELKNEYREVIILRFVNELSIAEIAEILDKSKGNVRVLVYRALKALREVVK